MQLTAGNTGTTSEVLKSMGLGGLDIGYLFIGMAALLLILLILLIVQIMMVILQEE